MLDIYLSIYIFGCFMTILAFAVLNCTLGKIDPYWYTSIDEAGYWRMSQVILFSWLTIVFLVIALIKYFYDKSKPPKDSCSKR